MVHFVLREGQSENVGQTINIDGTLQEIQLLAVVLGKCVLQIMISFAM